MRDLRSRLQRLSERARPAADAFARLERARRRRERNRRFEAGVVAVLVAVAGSISAFMALTGGGETRLWGTNEDVFALWPEQTTDALAAAQERFAAGDPALAWRGDPTEVAVRFATEVLLWPDAIVITSATDPAADPDLVQIEVPPAASCEAAVERARCPTSRMTLTLDRLAGDDGVLSVTAVQGDELMLPLAAGDVVSSGTWVRIPTDLPDGTKVSMGIAFLTACDARGFDDNVEASGGVLEFYVPAVPEGCPGYVFAMLPPTGWGAVAIGSFLFTDAREFPAIGYLVDEVAAVPVRFIVPSGEPPTGADVLHVTCDRRAIFVDAAIVAAQSRGVHVVVENTSALPLFFQFAPVTEGPWSGTEVPVGVTELELQPPPGRLTIRCWSDESSSTDVVHVDVLDPRGLFVPFDLSCAGQRPLRSEIPVARWNEAARPEAIDFVRVRIDGLRPSDVLERAGYPAAIDPIVRLVREGAVVGKFDLFREFGEWKIGGSWCSNLAITVSSGSDPYPRGAFEWCPELPFGEPGLQWEERASDAAVQFVLAYVNGDVAKVETLLDPSVPGGTEFPVVLAEDAPEVIGTNARGGELVNFGCGNDVDAYTVAITIDDGTESASLDFTVYLIFRGAEGWKVWAVY